MLWIISIITAGIIAWKTTKSFGLRFVGVLLGSVIVHIVLSWTPLDTVLTEMGLNWDGFNKFTQSFGISSRQRFHQDNGDPRVLYSYDAGSKNFIERVPDGEGNPQYDPQTGQLMVAPGYEGQMNPVLKGQPVSAADSKMDFQRQTLMTQLGDHGEYILRKHLNKGKKYSIPTIPGVKLQFNSKKRVHISVDYREYLIGGGAGEPVNEEYKTGSLSYIQSGGTRLSIQSDDTAEVFILYFL